MENEEIAVAIGVLKEQVRALEVSMNKGFTELHSCFNEMKEFYSGSIKEINCKIEERIKESDKNQDRMDNEITRLKEWRKEVEECKLPKRVANLEKNWAVIAVISSIVGSIFFTFLGKLI